MRREGATGASHERESPISMEMTAGNSMKFSRHDRRVAGRRDSKTSSVAHVRLAQVEQTLKGEHASTHALKHPLL